MTTPAGKPAELDSFGLPRLSLGGKLEEDNRDHSRAPINSGGTITGDSFQTSNIDPRITIDSKALICHNAAGSTTVKINIATGTVDLLFGSGVAASLRFVDSAGALFGDLSYSFSGGGMLLESILPTFMTIAAVSAAGMLNTVYPVSYLGLSNVSWICDLHTAVNVYSQASGGISGGQAYWSALMNDSVRQASINLLTGVGAVNSIQIGDTSARLRIDMAGGLSIDFIGSNLLFNQPASSSISAGGHFIYLGVRIQAAAGGTAHGSGYPWRHLQTNAGGTAYVNPVSFVFANINVVNVNTLQIRLATYYGGMFTGNSIAAGIVEYVGNVTVS